MVQFMTKSPAFDARIKYVTIPLSLMFLDRSVKFIYSAAQLRDYTHLYFATSQRTIQDSRSE